MNLQDFCLVKVFTFLTEGTSGGTDGEERLALLAPSESVPILARRIYNKEHCLRCHWTKFSQESGAVNSRQVGLEQIAVSEDNRTHRLHLVADSHKARILGMLFAEVVVQGDGS